MTDESGRSGGAFTPVSVDDRLDHAEFAEGGDPAMTQDDDIDTTNLYGVGLRGERVVILRLRAELSKREALNLAAHLAALAEEDDLERFNRLLHAVRES